jgi:hypothetical protein
MLRGPDHIAILSFPSERPIPLSRAVAMVAAARQVVAAASAPE